MVLDVFRWENGDTEIQGCFGYIDDIRFADLCPGGENQGDG